jgi:orotidine-5'-phosphate decarboxylase
LSQPSAAARARLVFALDYPALDEARRGARAVRGEVGMVKVGLELYLRYGSQALSLAEDADASLFLDLKLHDIPATVGRAVENLLREAGTRAALLTVHASGGSAMLRAACQAAGDACGVVAVTVLTSLDGADLHALGIADDPAAQAERLARLAYDSGVRHFVCSPAEATTLRAALGTGAQLITPGVRPQGAGAGDQKRVMTPAQAIAAGADRLVIGRPIRDAADPALAARAIAAEIDSALVASP